MSICEICGQELRLKYGHRQQQIAIEGIGELNLQIQAWDSAEKRFDHR